MPRLFISHSSKDNVQALAFQRWLMANGWAGEDIFIDLHGIGAGERWRDTLRKANVSCEAVLLLASSDSLDSKECQREINLAEDLGKEIIVAILRDLQKDDARLARYADRQFVDLSQQPTERMEPFEHDGCMHRVEFHGPALASIRARLAHLGIAPGSFAWAPKDKNAGPYPGLAAFGEDDAGIFFGREAEIMAGITRLRLLRKRRAPRLLVIQAASGAGKSSFLRAGLWPRLERDPDFAPLAVLRPALGIVTGPDGLGRKLAPSFERHGRTKVPGEISARQAKAGPEAAQALASLIAEATALATTARRAGAPEARPPAPLLAIDQGEEMFAVENEGESQRFLEMLAELLKSPPPDVDPYVLVTIRADSVEILLQRWPALGLDAPETQVLPPLSPTAYRDVIVKPAAVYSERVRRLAVEPGLVDKLVHDATGADALPLLAFTLEKLFYEFGTDGNLTAERYDAMGGIGGSIDRALGEAQRQADSGGSAEHLRRLMVPWLATWDPAANAAKRLVALEIELIGGSRASLAPLVNALVSNRLLTLGAGTLEVAHEALLRRPPIDGWLEAQKDALKLRDDVMREARDWADGGWHAEGLVRRGARLESALALQSNEDFATALAPAKDYIAACQKQEAMGRRRARRTQAAIYTLMLGVIATLFAIIYKEPLYEFAHWNTTVRFYIAKAITPHLLSADKERALRRGDTFRECAEKCPEMVVIPPGKFMMGSPDGQGDADEHPQHEVAIAQPFAAGKFEVTFDDWEECVTLGGCSVVSAGGWGRGRQPVINVSWNEAKQYVAWLSRLTGKDYRLLSEAEWEYATRAGNPGKWSFGDDEAQLGDHAWFSGNSDNKTHPAGEKKPNAFGLHDMHGNVWEWVEDCYAENYERTPANGRAVSSKDCITRVVRGGSWLNAPDNLCSAFRAGLASVTPSRYLGFRIGRTLTP